VARDQEITETLFWLGFGIAVVDTMRDFSDTQGPIADIKVRRASLDDLDKVVSLDNELLRYLAGPPIFMAMIEKRTKEYHKKWLSKPSHALWLASCDGEVVSYMKICPLDENYVITDEKTAWIQGAFTKKHLRGKGIGTALLKQSLDWAQSQGYERCAVDFEGENVLASAFWTKHFQPICYSLIRQVDKRVSWAHKDRRDEHLW
jgi:GNAT superfamily N-acetyltransferase